MINRCRFSGSALRPSDAKTASGLTPIGLAISCELGYAASPDRGEHLGPPSFFNTFSFFNTVGPPQFVAPDVVSVDTSVLESVMDDG
jgi:hypothetical protein